MVAPAVSSFPPIRPTIKTLLLATLVFTVVLTVMKALDLGCNNLICHKDGYIYGARLIMASLILAWLGRLCLVFLENPKKDFQLFTSIATGLVVLMTYVFVRSLFNQIAVNIPISRLEFFSILLAMTGAAKYFQSPQPPQTTSTEDKQHKKISIAFALAILFALCILIADRELPRELLLSSDPDFHGFFGLQVERFGGVPYNQHEWGPQGFNYPAGSGVILFIWKLIGGVDQRDSLSVLPTLFTFLASLVIVESLIPHIQKPSQRTLIFISAIALTAAGLLFPLYDEYVHMEGSARQLSILFVALFMRFAISGFICHEKSSFKDLILPTLLVFLLMVLNPANIVIPGALVFALFIVGLTSKKPDFKLFFILIIGLLLAALDPYYHNLVGIAKEARVDTVIYAPSLIIKSLPEVLHQTVYLWLHSLGHFAHDFSVLLAESGTPLFLDIALFYAVFAFIFVERNIFKINKYAIAGLAAFIISLYLFYGFAIALTDDRRYFLLSPYIFFSLSQYKAMFLVLFLTWIVKKLIATEKNLIWTVASVILLVFSVKLLVRSEQGMFLVPRKGYCGPFDCVMLDDRVLLRRFEKLVKTGQFKMDDGRTPKVLLPNWVSQSEIETWVFPVSGARLYPYMKVLPAAFYYYHGDVDYSTQSYLAHVCDRFDRSWLLSKNIQYVFLPANREKACFAGMESLLKTEEVVLREGKAYLLKLRPVP